MGSLYSVQAVSRCYDRFRKKGNTDVKQTTISRILTALVLVLAILVVTLTSCGEAAETTDTTGTDETTVPDTMFDAERIEEVLKRLDSSWVNSLDEDLTEFIIESILLGTGDVYSNYMNKDEYAEYTDSYYGNFVGIGVTVQWNAEKRTITVYNVIPNSPASEVGFCPGDILVAVNGTPLQFEANDTSALDKTGDMIRGEAGTYVDVTVLRDGEEITYHTERRAVVNPTVWSEMLEYNGQRAMYIMLTGFDYTTPIEFKNAIDKAENEGADMVIFDLRNNPGGLLSVVSTMLTYLVEDDALLCTTEYKTSSSEVRAGEYVSPSVESEKPTLIVTPKGSIAYNQAYADHTLKLPCALLINQNSASAAELFTSVLRDYKLATLVGETTYGKGCMQVTYGLKDGYALKLTVAYYTPPCGINYDITTEGPVGIAPDLEVIFNEQENKFNLYTIDHTVDRQFVTAFNALTKGEKLEMPNAPESK